ncbi:hypothetical protein [Marinicella rhabdoformis]|uniref:hypothetical protein n=1 Tax=Marinicella rhabdoformis TaxID=2580566 RepID=UPI0012AEDCAE|nr:hypothetical protein [Marinicella rhabdoformis]
MKNIILTVILMLSACGMNPKLKKYPTLNQKHVAYSVALIKVNKKWFLEEFEKCTNGEAICMDPPPLALKAEVIEQITGAQLPQFFTIATTDHYAGDVYYWYGKDQLWLVKIKTDGTGFVMPRYARHAVHVDLNDLKVIEMDDNQISWLPCFNFEFKNKKFDFLDEDSNEKYEIDAIDYYDLKQLLQSHAENLDKECSE